MMWRDVRCQADIEQIGREEREALAAAIAEWHAVADEYVRRFGTRLFEAVNCEGTEYGDGYYPPYICMLVGERGNRRLGQVVATWPAIEDLPSINDPADASTASMRQQIAALRAALAPTLTEAVRLARETGATVGVGNVY